MNNNKFINNLIDQQLLDHLPEEEAEILLEMIINENAREEVVSFETAMSFLPMNEYGQKIYSDSLTKKESGEEVTNFVETQLPEIREALRADSVHGLLSKISDFVKDPASFVESRGDNQIEKMRQSFSSLMAYKIMLETVANFESQTAGKNLEFISAGLMGGLVPSDGVIEDFITKEGGKDIHYSLKLLKKKTKITGSLPLLYRSVVGENKDVIFLIVEKTLGDRAVDFEKIDLKTLRTTPISLKFRFYRVTPEKLKSFLTSNKSVIGKVLASQEYAESGLNFTSDAGGLKRLKAGNIQRQSRLAENHIDYINKLNHYFGYYLKLINTIQEKNLAVRGAFGYSAAFDKLITKIKELINEDNKEFFDTNNIERVREGRLEVPNNLLFFAANIKPKDLKKAFESEGFNPEATQEEKIKYLIRLFPNKWKKEQRKMTLTGVELSKNFVLINRNMGNILSEEDIETVKYFYDRTEYYRKGQMTPEGLIKALSDSVYQPTEETSETQDIEKYLSLFLSPFTYKGISNRELRVPFRFERASFIEALCEEDFDRLPIELELSSQDFVKKFEEFGEQMDDLNKQIVESVKGVCQNLTSFNRGFKKSLTTGMSTDSLMPPFGSLTNLVKEWNKIAKVKRKQGK